MLRLSTFSLPFILLRLGIIVIEILVMVLGIFYGHKVFEGIMIQYVDGIFLRVVSPMGYIIGLGLAAFFNKYILNIVKYYLKLAHIIFITTMVLDYKPYTSSRFIYSLSQAGTNFTSMALNDFTTRGLVKVLESLRDAIFSTDFMSKFKEPKNTLVKIVYSLCQTGLKNMLNLLDEIIVSYTWFANDLYVRNRERTRGPKPNLKTRLKAQAGFFLEGISFTTRILPQLMAHTLLYEVLFFFIAHGTAISVTVGLFLYFDLSLFLIIVVLGLYRTFISFMYYVFIEPLRMMVFIYTFYTELAELEAFDIKGQLAKLLYKVPVLGALIEKSGQTIEPIASGDSILEGDISSILKDNVKEVASSFNLSVDDLINEQPQETPVEEEQEPETTFADSDEEIDVIDLSGDFSFDEEPNSSNETDSEIQTIESAEDLVPAEEVTIPQRDDELFK